MSPAQVAAIAASLTAGKTAAETIAAAVKNALAAYKGRVSP